MSWKVFSELLAKKWTSIADRLGFLLNVVVLSCVMLAEKSLSEDTVSSEFYAETSVHIPIQKFDLYGDFSSKISYCWKEIRIRNC